MKTIDKYFSLQEEIYKYFGYTEDWRIIPLDDSREYYWYATGEGHGDEVHFSETKEELENLGHYYAEEIYTQRFLPKWVYRGEEFTMICVDTHTDGNKLLRIFSNAKEIKKHSS